MLNTRLEDRFREALEANAAGRDESIRFAAHFVTLLARALPETVTDGARAAMASALRARAELGPAEIELLIDLALAPENRSTVSDHELRAFGARFGRAEEEALRAAVDEEIELTVFAQRYGPAEALLLLDSLFAVCAEDDVIDQKEIGRLQQTASELGIDPMLVGALFRKHDPRHASGDFNFELTENRYLIGRAISAGIQLPDPQVAIRHAELVRAPDGWRVVDLGSGRPTLLNGAATTSAPFRPGDTLRLGPYTLQLDRAGATLTAFGPAAFSALSVRGLKRKIGEISLLDGVSFTVFSGEVIALVGPSGAGKTTLLNAIAGIAPADSGDVLLDGQPFHNLLQNDRSMVGIVPQDDVVHTDLTVNEALWYAARLRYPKDVGADVLQTEVERVLDELGIDHIAGSRIGNQVKRGISGGQRKRVSLGQELLTRSTKVLFLDEPTSGLDPQTAQDIVGLVRHIADEGRIVFLVTHDVSPAVMSMVDHLIVMAPGGRLAWFGPPDDACAWFGVDTPDGIFSKLQESSPQVWGQRYRDGEVFRKYVRTREHLLGLDGVEAQRTEKSSIVRRSGWLQYHTLTRRYARVKWRDSTGTAVLLAQAPILGIAMWLVFPDPDTATAFMLALSSLWFGASASVRELIADRSVWQRERRVGLQLLPYMASKVTVLGALVAVQCATLAFMTWWLLSMGAEPSGFALGPLVSVCALTGWVGMSLGLLMSSLFSSSEAAVGTLPLVLIPQITFGGLIVKVKGMSAAAKLASQLMITRYSFEATLRTGTRLINPEKYGRRPDPTPINGVLSNLGFRDDVSTGLSLVQLHAVLGVFLVIFLVGATWMTSRGEKD